MCSTVLTYTHSIIGPESVIALWKYRQVKQLNRRAVLGWTAGTAGLALAGCLGDNDDDDQTDQAGDDDSTNDNEADDDTGGSDIPSAEGLVYVFAPEEINLVDPDEGEVVLTVATDLGGRD